MNNAGDAAARAYKSVFDILRTIGRSESPFEKIRCVLNALQEINARVQCFFNARSHTKAVAMFVLMTFAFSTLSHHIFVHTHTQQRSRRPGVDCSVLPGQVRAEERGERVPHDGGLYDVVDGAQPGRLLCCHVLCLCSGSSGACHLRDSFPSLSISPFFPNFPHVNCGRERNRTKEKQKETRVTHQRGTSDGWQRTRGRPRGCPGQPVQRRWRWRTWRSCWRRRCAAATRAR